MSIQPIPADRLMLFWDRYEAKTEWINTTRSLEYGVDFIEYDKDEMQTKLLDLVNEGWYAYRYKDYLNRWIMLLNKSEFNTYILGI